MALSTDYKITWCPGCPDFIIKKAIEKAVQELITKGYKQEDFVMVTDIGCNSKIYDYLNLSGFYGLHGRTIPAALGVKIGNPKLTVIGIAGDGGTLNEGLDHFIHACRYNTDITFLLFNNQVFSLTTRQATATTEEGFMEKTHPSGVKEKPLNPVVLALEAGATFVARTSSLDLGGMSQIIQEAIVHKGFSFVDIIQPCIVYHDTSDFLRKNCYKIEPMDLPKAIEEARKWDYAPQGKIPMGIFYQVKEETFEEKNGLK